MYVSAFFSIVGNAQFVAATYRLFKVLNSSETVASRVTYKGMSNSEQNIKTSKRLRGGAVKGTKTAKSSLKKLNNKESFFSPQGS